MAAIVSLDGIDEAIKNLDYKAKDSPKLRLIQAIRAYYTDELVPTTLQAIDPDTLVNVVWDVPLDADRLRSRRKNLTSLRSSVNQDLKRLFEKGKNPDGIVIGPSNTFVMTDEAKDQMLSSVAATVHNGGPISLGQITRTLSMVEELLKQAERFSKGGEDDRESGMRRLKRLIQQIARRIDLDIGDEPTQGGLPGTYGPTLYPGEESGSDGGQGRPSGDEGMGHVESELSYGNSEWSGIDGVVSGEKEDVQGFSGGKGGNQVGVPRKGDHGEGTGIDGDGSSGESAGSVSDDDRDSGPLPEAVGPGEEDLDEVEVIDEPEGLEVLDESDDLEVMDALQAEGLDVAVHGHEPGANGDSAPLQPDVEGSGQGLEKEKESGGKPRPECEGFSGAAGSLAEDGSVGDRIGLGGTEAATGVDGSEAGFSSPDGEPLGPVVEGTGDGPGEAVSEPIQEADFLPADLEAEEEEIEEVEEAILSDGTSSEDETPIAETGPKGIGPDADIVANEKGGSLQGPDNETGEGPNMPVPGDPAQAGAGKSGSQTAFGQGQGDPPKLDGQVDLEALDLDEIIEEEDDSDTEALEEAAGSENGEGQESGTGSGPGVEPSGRGQGMDPAATPEMGLPLGSLGFDPFEDAHQTHDGAQKKDLKLLAEAFDGYLGAMERFYNQYILIPKGVYKVGGGFGTQGLSERRIRLPEYYMGKFPVTNALFEIFVEKTGYRTSAETEGHGVVYYARSKKKVDAKTGRGRFVWNAALVSHRVDGACWYQPLGPGSTLHRKRNHPVVQVSLEDAAAFAAWTGKRLPSEAEWEAASRSKEGHLYPWGDVWMDGRCNVEETQLGDTTPVDAQMDSAGPLGIADTLGNVMEWTLDRDQFGENDDRPCYIVKGGCWTSQSDICLCSRLKMEPGARSNILGFRCVAS